MKKRVIGLDVFRGWALLFMMTYHFTFDLNYFRFIHVDMNHEPMFLLSRYTIMSRAVIRAIFGYFKKGNAKNEATKIKCKIPK